MKGERREEGDSSAEIEGGIGRDKANFGPLEINYCPHLRMWKLVVLVSEKNYEFIHSMN